MSRKSVLFAVLVVALLLVVGPASAQSRSVFWRNWDVVIDNIDTVSNQFDVAEIYNLEFTGSFRFGSRVITRDNLDDIRNIRVSQDGQTMRAACSEAAGTYCVRESGDEVSITYYFFSPISNGKASFRIEYTVVGALRVYEGGDQLWWTAIPSEHFGFNIGSSTVRVSLPSGYGPREGVDPVVSYGAPTNVSVNGTEVTYTTTRQLGGYENLEVRVQFPHNPAAQPAGWQGTFDQRRDFEENTQPIINLGVLIVSLLIALGGPLLIYTTYQRKGRDPKTGPVPEYLSKLPSNLPPAVVGTLLDERADVRDVMSTLIDLGQRGYLVIEEEQTAGLFGIGRSSEFTFKRTDKAWDELRPFEERVMRNVFSGSKMERSLDSLKNRFYSVIPQVQNDLYDELVTEGFFTTKPSTTRNIWSGIGVAVLALTGMGVFFLAPALGRISPMLVCLPASLGLTGVMALVVGQFMPAKTLKGAEEAAKWGAFQEYLRNLEKYGDVEDASVHFSDYLPYAVAFGLDRSWMQKFRQVDYVPMPPWYFPTYMGGPYGRGYIPGTPVYRGAPFGDQPGSLGELARAPGAGMSMETLSESMSVSMENLSNGLANMMESATRAMTSRPQSASTGTSGRWGGGGSSWSGGGFSGGGSSGGGSSGFG